MKTNLLQLNLALAWVWIVLGFVSGAVLGMNFHRADWLGGYTSHRRRLYRLGHISFFGLAIVNLLFVFTFRSATPPADPAILWIASRALALGAVTMPLCCAVAAHRGEARALFSIPVTSLLVGGIGTLLEVTKP
jgi:hypothetical protein